ncbi:hypothetical protein ACIRO1_35910 [Streptomyces sp. NPDC102381]
MTEPGARSTHDESHGGALGSRLNWLCAAVLAMAVTYAAGSLLGAAGV